MRTTHVLIVTMMVLCGCSDDGAQIPAFDPDSDASRELIAKAASMPNADFEKLTTAATPPGEGDLRNQPLTLALALSMITDSDDFRVVSGETVSPIEMSKAMWKSKARGYASVIQPEYIRSCEMSAAGGADGDAKGVVTFEAEGLYSGKVEFTARHEDGIWKIVEFRLPAARSRTVLGEDGKWKVVK